MKILMVGDIVGEPGRRAFAWVAARMRHEGAVDFIVADAENAAGGKGLTGAVAEELFAAGADVLTLGDHAWDQKEIGAYLEREERVIRPANFAPGCPGRGLVTVRTDKAEVTVISLVGRVFMGPNDCPFRTVTALLEGAPAPCKVIIVEIHAEATSEKVVLGRYLDGRASCVAGTHTHIQTADEQVLPGGTAYITDLGMTGPSDSALGRDLESVTSMFLTGMPARFKLGSGGPVFHGAVVDVDEATGRARGIRRLRRVPGDCNG
jgi:metallophosphoesterase (TIGR00282 family)